MSEKDHPSNPYVSRSFCDERFGQFRLYLDEKFGSLSDEVKETKKMIKEERAEKRKEREEKREENRQDKKLSLKYRLGITVAFITGIFALLASLIQVLG